jgi:ATP-citrate lyase beta-subunit
MAQRAIREFDTKKMLAEHWKEYFGHERSYPGKFVQVTQDTDWDKLKKENEWLEKGRLAVKPDQLSTLSLSSLPHLKNGNFLGSLR